MMEAVVPLWETDDEGNMTSLRLLPVELGMKCKKSLEGLPTKAKNLDLVKRLADMSAPYGVSMQVEADGTVTCSW